MKTIPEDQAALVIVTIKGPFGLIKQTSTPMRVSEAVATTVDLLKKGYDAEIVRRDQQPTIKVVKG